MLVSPWGNLPLCLMKSPNFSLFLYLLALCHANSHDKVVLLRHNSNHHHLSALEYAPNDSQGLCSSRGYRISSRAVILYPRLSSVIRCHAYFHLPVIITWLPPGAVLPSLLIKIYLLIRKNNRQTHRDSPFMDSLPMSEQQLGLRLS